MESQKPIVFGFGFIFMALLVLLVNSMNFLLAAEKSYLYVGLSMILCGLFIYSVRD